MRPLVGSLLVGNALMLGFSSGCQACTLKGCGEEGATIEVFSTDGSALPEGTWTITVSHENDQASYECVNTNGDCSSLLAELGEEMVLLIRWDEALTSVELKVVGSEEEAELGPEQLRVQIADDGGVVLDETWTPMYEVSEPNGPDCGTCGKARLRIEAPW